MDWSDVAEKTYKVIQNKNMKKKKEKEKLINAYFNKSIEKTMNSSRKRNLRRRGQV